MPTVLDLQEVLHCPGRMSRDVVILKEPTAFLLNYSLTPGIHSITCLACFYKSLFFPLLWHKLIVDHTPVYGKKSDHFIVHLCR